MPPALLPLILLTALLVACSDEDTPSPTPTATATTAAPVLEAEIEISDPQPFTISPLDAPTPPRLDSLTGADFPRRLIYDRQTGVTTVVDAGHGASWAGWLHSGRLFVRHDNQPAIYDAASSTWSLVDLGFALDVNAYAVVSSNGSNVVLQTSDQLLLLDMEAMTYQALPLVGRDHTWSPDSTRLMLRLEEDRHHITVIDLARPGAVIRLPPDPLASADSYGQAWLDDTRIAIADVNSASLVVLSLAGVQHQTSPSQTLLTGSASFSPDGKHLAVSRVGFQATDQFTAETAFYAVEPFALIAEYDGLAIADYGPEAWFSDGSRIVALRDACNDAETLVVLDISTGEQTDIAPGGTSQLALSPDETLVAYAASTPEFAGLFITPVDGSTPAEAIFQLPGAPAAVYDPQWSSDGRFIAFGLGGYDRCP